MTERVYVALDLETTGLDAGRDAIIEIGAVRFQGATILDRFVTFVNPQRAVPLRIQQITGICDDDVAAAPTIAQILPELMAFVSADVAAVVAHNAGFDLSFLRAAGLDFRRPAMDTFELASILLPGMASYSLSELCRSLHVPLADAHRALDDAMATAELFDLLQRRLAALPAQVLELLVESGQDTDWPPLRLFADCLEAGLSDDRLPLAAGSTAGAPPDGIPLLPPMDEPSPARAEVPVATMAAYFAVGGPLQQQLGDTFEVREGQVEMAARVLAALNTGDHLLIEAGTGTGKSLAYLLPAALWSLANRQRVVIATNTIALQDQLLDKDIPQVQAMLQASGSFELRGALLKGRQNYLCTRRLQAWRGRRRLNATELRVLAKVLVWLPTTRSGDVSELFLPTAAERAIWLRICSDSATCSADRCAAQRDRRNGGLPLPARDYFLLARQQAEAAHLLVVNHALLLADIGASGRVLPAYDHLVIDEAHRLEDAATDQLTFRVDWTTIAALLTRLTWEGDLLRSVAQAAASAHDALCHDKAMAVSASAYNTMERLRTFADLVLQFVRSQASVRTDTGYNQRFTLDGAARTQPAWSNLEVNWDRISGDLRQLGLLTAALTQHLEQQRWHTQEPQATHFNELQAVHGEVQELADWLDEIIFRPEGAGRDIVTWLELGEKGETVSLLAAPYYVNDIIERELIQRKRSLILTGATLRTGSGFSFLRERLGLWNVPAATVASPFDFRQCALLYLPTDVPEPNHPHYQAAVERAIVEAAKASAGGTLVLFTSYAHLRTTAEAVRAPLDRAGITVLQHGTSSRQRLLREYRQTDRAVLMGTRSFWEGVDLPGDELRCLIIVRLPFAVPSDPLFAARSAEFDDPFHDYTVPDAILRLRQGFGRLIRRKTDRGVAVILDSRLLRKQYGQAFLESLPDCTRRQAPLANLAHDITAWLQRPAATDAIESTPPGRRP